MNYKKPLIVILISIGNAFALSGERTAACNLDRTVESLDMKTWLTAKSRASTDFIGFRYNENVLYLGMGRVSDIYTHASNTQNKTNDLDLESDLYTHSNGSAFFLLRNRDGLLVVFSKSGIGPFFLGSCEMKNK